MSVYLETLIHSVRCLLVWNKIFCDAPNISSTVVNIYQMGEAGGQIFCIIGKLLSVCLIVTQTCWDGRERERATSGHSYIWHMVTGKFRATRQTYNLQITFVKVLLFYFVASNILKGQVLWVWDVRNCVKITKSPFLSPFYTETRVSKGEETYKG